MVKFLARWLMLAVGWSAGLPAHAAVDVNYADPARFSEYTGYGAWTKSRDREAWLAAFKRYVETRAAKTLPEGQSLSVTITDLERAGRIEFSRRALQDVRVVRSIDAPRIDLRFTLQAADGSVLGQGERYLRDPAFQLRGAAGSTDPMAYEKRLIDDWLAEEFGRRP